jgi:CubicO group peptidase (beta-lactamase class C family)
MPGAAVALIYQGKVAWTEGFGVTDRSSGRPVDAHTIFSIQSTSKNITATAIMLAVQQGILALDEPITTYLPGFLVNSRFESDPQKKMTLRLLLSHRAGFTHEAPVGNNYYPASPSFEAHIHSISDTWLRYPVGERFAYSNLGVDLAGYILQEASGVPFAEWVKTRVFDPLGMADSTCSAAVYRARKNRAVGHEEGYQAVPLEIPIIPSGGVYTSAKDMATYAQFHLDAGKGGGKQILEKNFWDEMHSFPSGSRPYGLGVERERLKFDETIIDWFNHNGGGFGFASVFSFYPQAGLAWVGMFNMPVEAGYKALDDSLSWEILTRLYGKKTPVRPAKDLATVDVPKEVLDKFAGRYLGRGGEVYEVTFRGSVLGMRQDNTFQKLSFTSPTDAFLTEPSGETEMLHLDAANGDQPKRLVCPGGPSFGDLDYNDGPADAPGPDKKDWQEYLGDYQMRVWGKPVLTLKVQVKNGYLYLGERKLIAEYRDGLFFSADGEALDFRGTQPTWESILLERVQS